MPGIYAADRNAAPGRGGLLLNYTPGSTGPLPVNVDTAEFMELPMSNPWAGPVGDLPGISTSSMSDCIVVSISEWAPDGWRATYFHHIAGGNWDQRGDDDFTDFLQNVQNRSNCASVVFASYETGTDSVLSQLKLFFPMRLCSLYLTQANSADVAVVFDQVGTFGEIFAGGERTRYGGYGYCGPISQMIRPSLRGSEGLDALDVYPAPKRYRSLGDNPSAKEAPASTHAGRTRYRGWRPARVLPL
jgi:hypothetical protein